MAQEFTLLPQDYLTMNYLRDVASKINNHLDKVKNPFIAVFSPDNLKRYLDVTVGISNVIDHDRLVYLYKNIVNGGGDSDLKYGFQLSKPNIYVSIYIAKNSPQYDNFYSLAKNIGSPYELDEITKGIALELKLDISKYLNDANVDKIISDWFCQTFDDFKVLVKNNSNIDWNICCPPKI